MLSALVLLEGDPASPDPNAPLRAVTKSLGALVGAVVDEVIADAFVVGRPGPDLRAVQDGTGCDVVLDIAPGEALRRALERARRPHILLLRAGHAPGPDFAGEVASFLAEGAKERALLLRAPAATLGERLTPGFAAWRRAAGLVASRTSLQALPASSLDALRAIARALPVQVARAGAVRL